MSTVVVTNQSYTAEQLVTQSHPLKTSQPVPLPERPWVFVGGGRGRHPTCDSKFLKCHVLNTNLAASQHNGVANGVLWGWDKPLKTYITSRWRAELMPKCQAV